MKDGIVSTAVSTNAQWEKFCKAMGMEELLGDPRYATNESRGENYLTSLREIIAGKLGKMTKWEIEETLRPLNIPSGPGYTVPEAFDNEQLKVRNMVVEVDDKQIGQDKDAGRAYQDVGNRRHSGRSAPLLGEDTEDFLTALGLDEKKIGEMAAKGIVICGGGDRK